MTAKIIPFNYEGQAVRFNADGWLHATEIAERFGKEPAQWLRLDSTKEYIERLSECMQKSNVEKSHITLVKTRRGNTATSGTWLHPKLAVKFARWLSVDFEIWCDEQIDALLRGESKPWASTRREAAICHKAVCDAVALNCEAQGKTPQRYHFINEARLINEVITGAFTGRNRDLLSAGELELVTMVEIRDVLLMGQGLSFAERKVLLLQYVRDQQSKHPRRIAV
ncbi:KilA-N domain-containing protein [Pseudomonas sp. MCal1]|uniref:KilA-N domain-containing protein n=1 Tax=Pseudomonas sp. MCal1 TaxID=2919887 RepID=UPI00224F4140|nr:KilA-N domain-containing protein [Pseudomonas sp. MCal1]MCX4218737.1 KilA-N domain-containing protein [Pseudomonas sp. MCal1]